MRERSATKMTSPSSISGGRGASYEKMLVADTFLIIGCILLSFGLGLSFYNVPINAQDRVTTLDASNTYSQNFPTHLESGDILVLGVKPYAMANVSLLLVDANYETILMFQASEPGALLNLTYNVGTSGNYVIQVLENLTDPANRAVTCELEVMSVVFLASPSRPYIFYGVILVLVGTALLLFSRRTGVRMRGPSGWYEPRSYLLPSILLASTIGFSALLFTFMLGGSIQLGIIGDFLLVAFSALNMCALVLGITTLQDKPLMVFLRILLLSLAIWFVSLSILVVLLPSAYVESSPYWDIGVFLTSMEGIAAMNQAFSQIVTLVVILAIAYCLSYRYGKHRIYSYQVEAELVDAGTLKELQKELEGAVGRKDLREFFEKLREKDLEASVFLFYILSDHANKGAISFTYHGIIAGRRDTFSKDIYERDPAQKILKPLGFLKVSGAGRFKRHRLRTDEPLVNRLITLFNEMIEKREISSLSKWSGVDLLKERRMRYAGQLREQNQSTERPR